MLGKGDAADRAFARFARSYADQTEADHQALQEAVKSGAFRPSMVCRNPLAAMSGEPERNFILRMNHDIAVVVERPREAAGGRHVAALG